MRLGRPALPGVGVAIAFRTALARSRLVSDTPGGKPRPRVPPRAAPTVPAAPAYQLSATTSPRRSGITAVIVAVIIAVRRPARTCLVGPSLTTRAKATGRHVGRDRNGRSTTTPAISQ